MAHNASGEFDREDLDAALDAFTHAADREDARSAAWDVQDLALIEAEIVSWLAPEVVAALLERLSAADFAWRADALAVLGAIAAKSGADSSTTDARDATAAFEPAMVAARTLAQVSDPEIRSMAALLLARVSPSLEDIDLLLDLWDAEVDDLARACLAEATILLGFRLRLPAAQRAQWHERALSDEAPVVRYRAARLMRSIGDDRITTKAVSESVSPPAAVRVVWPAEV